MVARQFSEGGLRGWRNARNLPERQVPLVLARRQRLPRERRKASPKNRRARGRGKGKKASGPPVFPWSLSSVRGSRSPRMGAPAGRVAAMRASPEENQKCNLFRQRCAVHQQEVYSPLFRLRARRQGKGLRRSLRRSRRPGSRRDHGHHGDIVNVEQFDLTNESTFGRFVG